MVLNAPVTFDVTTTVFVLDADGGGTIGQLMSASPRALTFTPADWDTAQTVTVSGVPDGAVGDRAGSLLHVTNGSGYSNLRITLPATVADGDGATVTLSAPAATVAEAAGTAVWTVVLDAKPTGRVTARVAPETGRGDPGAVTASPGALTFTPTDWNTPRTVTATGVPDTAAGDRTTTFSHTFAGGGYDGVTARLPVTATDDDATMTLSATARTVAEAGGTAAWTVALDVQPTGPVTVAVTSASPLRAAARPPRR